MAISEPTTVSQRLGGRTAAHLLFERLPDKLFFPLASTNRHRYWAMLCRLHDKRFGPDAPLPPSHGFAVRDLMQDIEDELLMQDMWEEEEGHTPGTPIAIRSNAVFNYLADSGWFRLERHGVEKKVTMRPAVSQFLTVLVSFAETGPVFVSGKIRSIDLNIQQVAEGKAEGDTLAETAEQARNLLEHVRNTGTNIRDIMDSMNVEITTAQYVQRFFNDYIEQVFIGDYRELRTREHPLSRRPQILRTVEELHGNEQHRARLISWYEAKRCAGDRRKAEQLFEKDIYRLFELRRIDEYLDRLDDEIRRANRRALAFLDYRLRSLRPVDHMVKRAIAAALSNQLPILGDPFPAGEMVCGESLAEPRKQNERSVPSILRRQVPSDMQLAKSRIMLRARESRSITLPKLAEYVHRQLDGQTSITNDVLSLDSIRDIRSYQTLASVGLAMSSPSRRLQLSAMTVARGFRICMSDAPEEIAGEVLSGRPFTIEVRSAEKREKEQK
ncbi:MAG: hypothetical protein A3F73_10440 [Gallionellales bacterium RIFCSPLOWO2_12_FULL_59_22]|nr:MAG: hypothetical protein A3H99_07280 [Gallionellales bacterium RIFCSPLOWO2_02_FULL_59_110]OGT02601.1 MAG: hypothetical protein A2Z65_03675 [Gallionellales bacterium RIFCSPLOWO2_02_58_13]OGT13538.1 MAG: hypothetical protein A3F73_10440 [Gallionellales bacterium RIFCSPLOWO2_12_FULL_59_22]